MPTLVVPFRGVDGKSRLEHLRAEARAALAHAMLADVVEACLAIGDAFVVAPVGARVEGAAPTGALIDGAAAAGRATPVEDPGGGQGAAVAAGLDAAVAAASPPPYLVVNADLPCVTARDLFTLAGSVPDGGIALTAAADGTTNALALASAGLFAPVFGPGSAERFAALAPSNLVDAPNLVDDVDTVEDLLRLRGRLGRHTRGVLATLRFGAAA